MYICFTKLLSLAGSIPKPSRECRSAAYAAIDAEPQYPDGMPPEMKEYCFSMFKNNDLDGLIFMLQEPVNLFPTITIIR